MTSVYDRPPYKKASARFHRMWLRVYGIGFACLLAGGTLVVFFRLTWACAFLWACAGFFFGIWFRLGRRWSRCLTRTQAREVRKINARFADAIQELAGEAELLQFDGKSIRPPKKPPREWRN